MAAGGTYASLISLVQSKKGWFAKLTVPAGGLPSERSVANPVLLGGIVFFPTFSPSGDVCVAAGSSNLYALYYVTGGAYSRPSLGRRVRISTIRLPWRRDGDDGGHTPGSSR